MHDPIPPIPWLSKAVTPFSEYVGFPTLPLHIHEVVASFFAYHAINIYLAPIISKLLFPRQYAAFTPVKRMNWNVHIVSLCQSTFINTAALWVMFNDEERKNMTWQERIWGYTGAAGMIQGLAAGYFVWDLMITIQHFKVFGIGMLAHAISALSVFSFGFRPFVNYYGSVFILYELSSPFLNFHWFFDKLDMTGSRPQLYNGLVLLFTFFCCRLCWGTYSSVCVFWDIWRALQHDPISASVQYGALGSNSAAAANAASGMSAVPVQNEIMKFAKAEQVPVWLALIYLASNITLNILNFYWFGKMIDAVRKRFQPKKDVTQDKAIASKSTGTNGTTKVGIDQTEVRRRNVIEEVDPLPVA